MSAFGAFGGNQGTSAFGAFGNNAQQQPQQQQPQPGGLFGSLGTAGASSNAPAQQNAAGGSSLFGSSTQNATPTGGGLFGNAPAQTGGGLFGNSSATQQQQQQQQQQQPGLGGGLFGNTNTQQPAGGGLLGFNAQPSTGGGLFGNAGQSTTGNATGGGLFGLNTSGQNTATTGGLFGNAGAANGATSSTGTGGLFGTSTNTSSATGGGLFGNTATTAPSGGGLFSNTGTNGGLYGSSANTAATGGGLFGNSTTSTAAPSGGIFGQTQTNQPSLFGQTQQARPTGSLFGQPAQQPGTLFNQSQQQQPQGTLFGSLNQSAAVGNSLLGGNTAGASNLFASRPGVASAQQPDTVAQFITLLQRIDAVKQAWDPNSPQCRFQHFFYNLVDPAQVQFYGRPMNARDDGAWQKAVRENPDPSCLVPVLAVGLDDLQQRVDAQTKQATEHQEKLKELKTRIEALTQRHQLTNVARLGRAAALQTQLTHRVLRLVQHLHLLIPALRSSSIRPEEEALRAALEDIDDEIRRPGGLGKMRGKLNELWALVDAVRAARENNRQDGLVEWAVVDDEGLSHLAQILAEEQAGLAHVTKILQKGLKDLAVIQGVPVKQEEPDVLSGSVSALRGSVLR